MIAKGHNYLVTYIRELDLDISCQWCSDNVNSVFKYSETKGRVQIASLSWVRIYYEAEKQSSLLLY